VTVRSAAALEDLCANLRAPDETVRAQRRAWGTRGWEVRLADAVTPDPAAAGARATLAPMALSVDDARFAQLAALRTRIRRYLAWAEWTARDHGRTPAQVQLALAIRAYADPDGPTLTELSETLLLRHRSVVGLVDRAERNGFVGRKRDPEHHALVRVRLTATGAERLRALSALHLERPAEPGAEIGDGWKSFT
jgi:DNA-binding MarR family transcriptional regulator